MSRTLVLSAVLLCWCCESVLSQVIPGKSRTVDGEYNSVNTDGSFDFGYANPDRGASYHVARGNAARVVGGRFGARDPSTGTIKETVYTAGPRGFRAKGPNIHRKMDLDQRPRGPIGNRDDPYFDPSEDPSYDFQFKTRTYSKKENADSRGDVKGHYSYVDDVGERHDVSYIAGRDTGFHVSSPHPDSPAALAPLYYRAPLVRGEKKQRGRSSVQRGLDGSYRFISAGPDQRRTESSDANGNVRGSYTFLDDKGVQRTVHYIAGPGIGYRIVKNSKDPYIPSYFPTIPSAYDPDFALPSAAVDIPTEEKYHEDDSSVDDIFKSPEGTSASGHVKPPPFSSGTGDKGNGSNKQGYGSGASKPSSEKESSKEDTDRPYGSTASDKPRPIPVKPSKRPSRPQPGRPTNKPYVPLTPFRPKPSSGASELDSNEAGIDDAPTKGNGYIPGKDDNKSEKDGYKPDKNGYSPNRPHTGEGYESDKDDYSPNKGGEGVGPQYGIGFNIDHTKPGTTIIRNIGEDYFGVPPGVSVRAHVQSIDLFPFGSKRLSPSEAIDEVKD